MKKILLFFLIISLSCNSIGQKYLDNQYSIQSLGVVIAEDFPGFNRLLQIKEDKKCFGSRNVKECKIAYASGNEDVKSFDTNGYCIKSVEYIFDSLKMDFVIQSQTISSYNKNVLTGVFKVSENYTDHLSNSNKIDEKTINEFFLGNDTLMIKQFKFSNNILTSNSIEEIIFKNGLIIKANRKYSGGIIEFVSSNRNVYKLLNSDTVKTISLNIDGSVNCIKTNSDSISYNRYGDECILVESFIDYDRTNVLYENRYWKQLYIYNNGMLQSKAFVSIDLSTKDFYSMDYYVSLRNDGLVEYTLQRTIEFPPLFKTTFLYKYSYMFYN